MKLSLISPSRNNLKYLQWSYESVRKNCSPDIEYCVAVDFSNDGTEEWCEEISKKDPNFKYIAREQTKRWGHTIFYDILIEEIATGDIIMIWHADMYATSNMDKIILSTIKRGQVISLTRIEPPLHPLGAEKLVMDFGFEPEEFKEQAFFEYVEKMKLQYKDVRKNGIFAPWTIFRDDFLAIGGHDPLFAPQSREDSDIFNRFILAGYETIQLFDTFVYHMTCRGSRFSGLDLKAAIDKGHGFVRQTSEEWMTHNRRSERNFIRKWSHMVKTDHELKPIIPPKYKIAFVVTNVTLPVLHAIEPWASCVFVETHPDLHSVNICSDYIDFEQKNTAYNLNTRVRPISELSDKFDIFVSFNGNQLTNDGFKFLTQLPEVIAKSGSIGEFTHDIFKIQIFNIKSYEQELIKLERKNKDEAIEAYLKNDKLP